MRNMYWFRLILNKINWYLPRRGHANFLIFKGIVSKRSSPIKFWILPCSDSFGIIPFAASSLTFPIALATWRNLVKVLIIASVVSVANSPLRIVASIYKPCSVKAWGATLEYLSPLRLSKFLITSCFSLLVISITKSEGNFLGLFFNAWLISLVVTPYSSATSLSRITYSSLTVMILFVTFSIDTINFYWILTVSMRHAHCKGVLHLIKRQSCYWTQVNPGEA